MKLQWVLYLIYLCRILKPHNFNYTIKYPTETAISNVKSTPLFLPKHAFSYTIFQSEVLKKRIPNDNIDTLVPRPQNVLTLFWAPILHSGLEFGFYLRTNLEQKTPPPLSYPCHPKCIRAGPSEWLKFWWGNNSRICSIH